MHVKKGAVATVLLFFLSLSSATGISQTSGVPGHIVHCDPSCSTYGFTVHTNDSVTIVKYVTSDSTGITFTYFQTALGDVGALPSYYVQLGPPARDPVEIATKMILMLAAAGWGVYMFFRHSKKSRKVAATVALVLFCVINGFSQTSDGFNPPKLHFGRPAESGPFGFMRGMTKDQIIERVGKENVAAIDSNALGGFTLFLRTAPKPYSAFSDYAVEVSPTQGLLNVEAFGKPIDTSEDGTELRREYSSVKDQLLSTYGLSTTDEDSLKPGSLYQEPHYFMLGLLKKDRRLVTFWGSKEQPVNGSISTIMLKADAKDLTTGFVTLIYSFAGWDEYYEQLKSSEGSVL